MACTRVPSLLSNQKGFRRVHFHFRQNGLVVVGELARGGGVAIRGEKLRGQGQTGALKRKRFTVAAESQGSIEAFGDDFLWLRAGARSHGVNWLQGLVCRGEINRLAVRGPS